MNKLKVCYYYYSYYVKDIEINLNIKEAQILCKKLKKQNKTPFVDYKIHYM